jgi:hypothetical protein
MQRHFHSNRFHAVAADGAVDWDHPLNRGKVGWWIPGLPGTPGAGRRVLDLVKRHHGTLSGSSTTVPTWGGTNNRRGGYGSLLYDGSTQFVSTNAIVGQFGAGDFAAFAWVQLTATGQHYSVGNLSGGGVTGWYLGSLNPSTPTVTSVGIKGNRYNGTTAINDSIWHLISMSRLNGLVSVYLDGKLESTPTSDVQDVSNGAVTFMGAGPGGGTGFSFWTGSVGEVGLYNRGLTDAEHAAIYLESLRGNLNTLRWVSTRTWFVPAGNGFVPYDLAHTPQHQTVLAM